MKKGFLIALFVFLCASPAYAYLDLGNGVLLFSILLPDWV